MQVETGVESDCFHRLKLHYDELVSQFASKFNLRRYTAGERRHVLHGRAVQVDPG